MPEQESRWRRFQTVKGRRKDLTRRAKRVEGATVRHAHRFIIKRWDNIRGVRRHILFWMAGVSALILVIGLQMMWFQKSYLVAAPVAGGTYAEAVRGPLATLNPLYATTSAEKSASRLLFSSLYKYDTTGHLKGDLATTMETDDSGKNYTISLRPGAVWSDGYSVTAKDIVYTVNIMKDPSARSVMNASWKDVEVTAVSDTSVRFTLRTTSATFPQALTFSVLPEHILRDVDPHAIRENGFSNSPVGSGPFKLRLLQAISEGQGRKIVHLAANERYYAGTPKLDRYQLHVYGTTDEIARALRTGEVSAASDVPNDTARVIDGKRYTVIKKPINNGVYAIINTTRPQLTAVEVRRALQLATNTESVREALYGEPEALDLPFVNGQLTGASVPKRPAVDMTQASKLLDTAGWKLGDDGVRSKAGQPLKLRVVTRKNSDYERVLQVLAGQWKKIGVDVEKVVVDSTAANQSFTQQVLQPRDYDVLIDELEIGADPDVFEYWHSRGRVNLANYSSVASDDALLTARDQTNIELRKVKYAAFATKWLEDVPAIGLYQPNSLYVAGKNVRSVTSDEKIIAPNERFSDVQYWTAEMKNVYKTP
ncbi:peptide ABC transporter substrate-binding protein [bacterium]|nr:MAG: peptide ABC transporter substrate-binding protein [bacterium]